MTPLEVVHTLVDVGDLGQIGIAEAAWEVSADEARNLSHEPVAQQLGTLGQRERVLAVVEPMLGCIGGEGRRLRGFGGQGGTLSTGVVEVAL
jgi:hypothetical protein